MWSFSSFIVVEYNVLKSPFLSSAISNNDTVTSVKSLNANPNSSSKASSNPGISFFSVSYCDIIFCLSFALDSILPIFAFFKKWFALIKKSLLYPNRLEFNKVNVLSAIL